MLKAKTEDRWCKVIVIEKWVRKWNGVIEERETQTWGYDGGYPWIIKYENAIVYWSEGTDQTKWDVIKECVGWSEKGELNVWADDHC
jgi:hypothetical protein